MIQFLHPIALISLAVLLLPVLVHLWHQRKGRVIRIGSTKLFTNPSQQQARNRRIRNWPLFIIRCLVLLTLTLYLCSPIYSFAKKNKATRGWIITSAGILQQLAAADRQEIDSLISMGYELRSAANGFPLLDSANGSTGTVRPWQLIRQLGDSLPKDFPLVIVSGNRLREFGGPRPSTALDVRVKLVDDDVSFNQLSTVRPADSSKRKIAVVEAKPGDARYITAAVNAIAAYTGQGLEMETIQNSRPKAAQDLIFAAVGTIGADEAEALLKPGGIAFIYLTTTGAGGNEWLLSTGPVPLGAADRIAINVPQDTRQIETPATTSSWVSANAATILTESNTGGKTIYRFAAAADATAGPLVWSEDFIYALLPLIAPGTKLNPSAMTMDSLQAQPLKLSDSLTKTANIKPNNSTAGLSPAEESLKPWLWMLLFVLLVAERIMAYHNKRMHSE